MTIFRRSFVLVAAAIVLMSVSVHSENLALVQVHLVDKTGAPLANQTVIIEGKKQVAKWSWLPFGPKTEQPTRTLAVTDAAGLVQVVDLPAGDYTLSLVWPGTEPFPVKKITLEPKYTNRTFYEKFPVAGASQTNTPRAIPEGGSDGLRVPYQAGPKEVVPAR